MNKFLLGTMAVLCTFFISCTKNDFDFEVQQVHQVESRSAGEITLNYLDSSGQSQTTTCKKASLSYLNSSLIQLIFTFSNGSTQAETGSNISIIPENLRLKVSANSSNYFLATDFYAQSCGNVFCYSYNNGVNVGTSSFFIVEDEPGGF